MNTISISLPKIMTVQEIYIPVGNNGKSLSLGKPSKESLKEESL